MGNAFIEPTCFQVIERGRLFYPGAGSDHAEFLILFASHLTEFRFADIDYDFGRDQPPSDPGPEYKLLESRLDGDATARLEWPTSDRPYRVIKPAHLIRRYERRCDGRRFNVILRRGFGQYALAELEDRSVHVFVHRGDSAGEGGSNVCYLGNRRRRHIPLSNLFEKLTRKLAARALIVSDGSNARVRFVRKFNRTNVEGREAYESLRDRVFSFGDRNWRCVGYIGPRYGPTLVWSADLRRQPE